MKNNQIIQPLQFKGNFSDFSVPCCPFTQRINSCNQYSILANNSALTNSIYSKPNSTTQWSQRNEVNMKLAHNLDKQKYQRLYQLPQPNYQKPEQAIMLKRNQKYQNFQKQKNNLYKISKVFKKSEQQLEITNFIKDECVGQNLHQMKQSENYGEPYFGTKGQKKFSMKSNCNWRNAGQYITRPYGSSVRKKSTSLKKQTSRSHNNNPSQTFENKNNSNYFKDENEAVLRQFPSYPVKNQERKLNKNIECSLKKKKEHDNLRECKSYSNSGNSTWAPFTLIKEDLDKTWLKGIQKTVTEVMILEQKEDLFKKDFKYKDDVMNSQNNKISFFQSKLKQNEQVIDDLRNQIKNMKLRQNQLYYQVQKYQKYIQNIQI